MLSVRLMLEFSTIGRADICSSTPLPMHLEDPELNLRYQAHLAWTKSYHYTNILRIEAQTHWFLAILKSTTVSFELFLAFD